jgi:lysophospholipase L1-like esterase
MIGTTVLNAGVSGDTPASALARIDNDVLSRNPRVVLIGLGDNDFMQGVPIGTTERNFRDSVRGSGAMVVILGFRFPSLTASYEKM